MREHKGHFQGVRRALAASIAALLAAAPALAGEAAPPAATRYVPTMADYLAVYDALQFGDTEFGPGGRLAGGGNPADTQAEDAQFPPGTEGAK